MHVEKTYPIDLASKRNLLCRKAQRPQTSRSLLQRPLLLVHLRDVQRRYDVQRPTYLIKRLRWLGRLHRSHLMFQRLDIYSSDDRRGWV